MSRKIKRFHDFLKLFICVQISLLSLPTVANPTVPHKLTKGEMLPKKNKEKFEIWIIKEPAAAEWGADIPLRSTAPFR